jgi:hypothetical protein
MRFLIPHTKPLGLDFGAFAYGSYFLDGTAGNAGERADLVARLATPQP